MSGFQEDLLVDLSEPVKEQVSLTESIEYLRDDPFEHLDVGSKISSPLKTVDSLFDTSIKSKSSGHSSPLRLIDDEKFDFDLPLTPSTSSDKSSLPDEDEEEVFFGPMGYRERCVSTVVESITKETKPLSPLNPRQIAEICKEANLIACEIASAASDKKNSTKEPKQGLFCSKSLKLDQINLSLEPEKKLLNSLWKMKTSNEREENKENCDKQMMEVDSSEDSLKNLEAFLRNDVPVIVTKPSSKSSSSGSESCDSPARRHNRSGTYTLDTTPHDLLPANKRKSIPVVQTTEEALLSVKKDSEQTGRRSISKLKQPSNVTKSSIPGMKGSTVKQVSKLDVKETSSSNSNSKPQQKSRLSAPKAGSRLPSKLKPVGPSTSVPSSTTSGTTASSSSGSSVIPAKPGTNSQQKSALPGFIGRGAPMSKLQLIKPGGLQKPGGLHVKNSDSTKKSGPMKAFAPIQKQEVEKAPVTITPSKQDKSVNPKNLSSSFSTPSRSGSTSSMDSPASSVQKRRSFLPTPNKSRIGSNGSNPSPGPTRSNSSSSQRSIESPLVRRPSSATRSATKLIDLDHIDDSSPSAMRPKRQLVTNTPNMPKKKTSQWSPIRKKALDLEDQAIMCTKKIRR